MITEREPQRWPALLKAGVLSLLLTVSAGVEVRTNAERSAESSGETHEELA